MSEMQDLDLTFERNFDSNKTMEYLYTSEVRVGLNFVKYFSATNTQKLPFIHICQIILTSSILISKMTIVPLS